MASVLHAFAGQVPAEVFAPSGIPLRALPFPAAILDDRGAILAANPEWGEFHPSCEPGDPADLWCSAVHPGTPSLSSALYTGVSRALAFGERFIQKFGDGDRFRVTVSPFPDGILVLHQDLCPEPERLLARKMETMGRLLAGVAHDFANILTLIDGYSDLLLKRISNKDPLRADLEEVRKAAGHGTQLTSRLLDFGRGQAVQPTELELNPLIAGVNRMLRPIIGETIHIETDLALDLDRVVADPGQMEQVIVNLLLNARDAMPRGGVIRISTASCGPDVLLSVADTGCGISSGVIPRVFEPFFTTKEKGKGTGLGLSTVREIVRQCHGDIRVQSEPGKGAVFTIRLPGVPRPVVPDRAAPPETPEKGHETVLLVEDEESVRRLLAFVLQNRGYQVLEAASGLEALPLLERNPAIDLVLTDIVMPGMNGLELVDRLRRFRPATRVVFMSGYADDVLSRTGPLPDGAAFVQKPLRPDVLAATVREALDSPSRPFNPR